MKASKDSEGGKLPSHELLAAMGKYNEELAKAGVLLSGEGLQPSSKGARAFGRPAHRDRRPIPRDQGVDRRLLALAGQVEGGGHRVGKRCPNPMPGTEAEIEIRQVFESEDFGAEFTPEPARAGGAPAAETRLTGMVGIHPRLFPWWGASGRPQSYWGLNLHSAAEGFEGIECAGLD